MTDTLDSDVSNMLFGDLPKEEPAAVEQEAEQPQAQPDPQIAPEPAPEPEQPENVQGNEATKEGANVPLAVFLEEKFKARDYKREAEDLRKQIEASQKPSEPVTIPDPYEDPQGYQSYVQNQVQQQAFNLRAEMSGRFAEQKFGKETVEAAIAWAQEQGRIDPTLGQRVQMSQSPVEFVVEQFNREQFFKQYGSDPSAIAALVAAQGTAAPQAPAAIQQPQKPQAPPRSLAAAPNAGGGHQAANGSVFDGIKLNLD